MYLLNHIRAGAGTNYKVKFTFHYVSIKSNVTGGNGGNGGSFTFHYVSIKSKSCACLCEELHHLHSTMYLLNLRMTDLTMSVKLIYIPLCIYKI